MSSLPAPPPPPPLRRLPQPPPTDTILGGAISSGVHPHSAAARTSPPSLLPSGWTPTDPEWVPRGVQGRPWLPRLGCAPAELANGPPGVSPRETPVGPSPRPEGRLNELNARHRPFVGAAGRAHTQPRVGGGDAGRGCKRSSHDGWEGEHNGEGHARRDGGGGGGGARHGVQARLALPATRLESRSAAPRYPRGRSAVVAAAGGALPHPPPPPHLLPPTPPSRPPPPLYALRGNFYPPRAPLAVLTHLTSPPLAACPFTRPGRGARP